MTEQEYVHKIKKAKEQFEKDIKTIQREYAFSNQKHEIGDILKDVDFQIIVDEIKWSTNRFSRDGLPCLVYIGRVLKKNGTPRKDGTIRKIFK